MVHPAPPYPFDATTYEATIVFFDELLRLLHPYMPFISEEIYQRLRKDSDPESIVIAPFPKGGPFKEEILAGFDFAEEVIMAIRNFRQEKNIPNKETLELCIKKNHDEKPDTTFDSTVMKMCNLSKLDYTDEKPADVFTLIIKTTEFYIPLSQNVDIEAEIEKLETDLKYQQGFLATVDKKLSNERFVSGAPEQVVAVEKKKQADALARISVIKAQLKNLKKN